MALFSIFSTGRIFTFVKEIRSGGTSTILRLSLLFSILGGMAMLLAVTGTIDILTVRIPLYILYLATLPYLVFILIRETVTGNKDARILITGILAILASFVPAILQAVFGIMSEVEAPIFAGSALLAAAMVAVLIRRLSNTYRELEVYSERLREADHQKDEFLAHTSHELRTPLNGIMGIAETLQNDLQEAGDENSQRHLSLIIASSRRLSNLVNDILDYSKLKNSKIRLERSPLDMKSLTDVVIEFMTPMIQHRDINIINAIPTELPLAFADEERCHQILYNLIGNAIKFTDAGTITITASECIIPENSDSDPKSKKNHLKFAISDTGVGMERGIQEKFSNPMNRDMKLVTMNTEEPE